MSRNEHDNLDNVSLVNIKGDGNEELEIPDPNKYSYTCILSNGEVVDSNDKNIKNVCAYCFESSAGRIKYFVLSAGGNLYDPEKKSDLRYNKRYNWTMRSVDSEVFKLYSQYLGVNKKNARRQKFLRNAERLL